MTDSELLKLCDAVIAEWTSFDADGKQLPDIEEQVVARALKSHLSAPPGEGQWTRDGVELLKRIRQWDHLDSAHDGPYWKREIDNYFAAPSHHSGAGVDAMKYVCETALAFRDSSGTAAYESAGDELDDALREYEEALRHPSSTRAELQGHDEPCYYCGKPCNSLSASPGMWPLPFCHRDDPGKVKWHHVECVTSRLIENQSSPPSASAQGWVSVKDRLPDKTGKYWTSRRGETSEVMIFYASTNEWEWFDVTHWQPINFPSPPTTQEKVP